MLLDTKLKMTAQVNRMQATASGLDRSSKALEGIASIYDSYGAHLQNAGALLSHLKRRAQSDSWYVWMAFLCFCSVCVFVVLKRTATIRSSIWVIELVASLVWLFLKSVVHVVVYMAKPTAHQQLETDALNASSSN